MGRLPNSYYESHIIPLDRDFGYVLGATVGDGCLYHSQIPGLRPGINSLSFQVVDEDFMIKFQESLTNVLDYEVKYQLVKRNAIYNEKKGEHEDASETRQPVYRLQVSNRLLIDKIKTYYYDILNMLNANREFLRGFIEGFTDAEGCVNVDAGTLCLSNSEDATVATLQTVFEDTFDIHFHARYISYEGQNHCPMWVLNIGSRSAIKKFNGEFTLSIERKKDGLSEISSRNPIEWSGREECRGGCYNLSEALLNDSLRSIT